MKIALWKVNKTPKHNTIPQCWYQSKENYLQKPADIWLIFWVLYIWGIYW